MGKPIRKIACCCGAGVASSMTAKYEIEDYLADHGVTDVEIICYRIEDFDDFVQNVQMVISATKLVKDTDIPIINGLCYLTNIGKEETNEKILNTILESRK